MQPLALIIEDSRVQASILTTFLKARDWVVLWAPTTDSAIQSFGLQTPHMLLLDVHLGVKKSLDDLPRIQDVWPMTPIAVMTSGSTEELAAGIEGGCRFALHKPVRESHLADVADECLMIRAGAPMRSTVLIVDDSAVIRRVAEASARTSGLIPTVVGTMEEAIAILKWDRIDCLVTDIFMPGMGGIAGIAHVREHYPTLPVVAISAGRKELGFEDALRASRKIGADRVLPKPFTPQALADAVRAAIIIRRKLIEAGDGLLPAAGAG